MEARKLNPLLLASDKFQLQKMHPIVSDHLLFSDRKRIITSVRGRRTDMPFRLGRECTSLIASLRNNFVLCLSFTLKSLARCVGEDSEMTVLWSALSQGCSTGNRARLHPSTPLFGKRKEKKCRNALNFTFLSSTFLLLVSHSRSQRRSSTRCIECRTCVQAGAEWPVYKLPKRAFSVFRPALKPLKWFKTFPTVSRIFFTGITFHVVSFTSTVGFDFSPQKPPTCRGSDPWPPQAPPYTSIWNKSLQQSRATSQPCSSDSWIRVKNDESVSLSHTHSHQPHTSPETPWSFLTPPLNPHFPLEMKAKSFSTNVTFIHLKATSIKLFEPLISPSLLLSFQTDMRVYYCLL